MGLYARIAGLELVVDTVELRPLSLETSSGWTRHTTVVRLHGRGAVGEGEDVTYSEGEQRAFQAAGAPPELAGTFTLDSFSLRLDAANLHPVAPERPFERLYRRWAFESAALDLALRQADRSLAEVLGRTAQPVEYVVSCGLGSPPSVDALTRRLATHPGLFFKVDLSESWTEDLIRDLGALDRVHTVDLKGQYRGSFQGPPADPDQYRWIAEHLPDAWIEDPGLTDATRAVLEPHTARITWDAILHSLADVVSLLFEPRCLNMKPSRFGLLSELLRVYEHCEARGIAMYGGGQFELGPGRGQIQALASLFHPSGPNDVAPAGFNAREPDADLPASPLAPRLAATGFAWEPA